MKRILVILALIVAMATVNQAYASEQLGLKLKSFEMRSTSDRDDKSGSGDGAAHKGMIILQPDFNIGSHGAFGGWFWDGHTRSNFVPGFTFNIDFGVHDYVSVGPYVGFGGKDGYMVMAVGGRVVFHWWQLLDDKVNADLKSDKIDFYLPVHLGVIMDRFKPNSWHSNFNGGGGLGFRYYFVKKFGVNLEWGWQEMSWAKIGLTVNLH
jgi:hypothetical protein